MSLRQILKHNKIARRLRRIASRHFSGNHYSIHPSSKFIHRGALLKNCTINIYGKNSVVEIMGGGNCLYNCTIAIYGDDCSIKIGTSNHFNHVEFWLEDNGSKIAIGNRNTFSGKLQLATIEGTKISIGNDNLFSSDIIIVTGDSHSILNLNNERINPSKDITIGNHNWIGNKVTIAKGVSIKENIIVGRNSLVLKSCEQSNVAIAGVPAKIVKENINWDIERI